jgi:hypothetical protein
MVLESFIKHYLDRLRDKQNLYKDRFFNGNIKNWEDYKETNAKLFGLKEAEEMALSLYDSMVNKVDFKERKIEEPERY